MARNTKPGEELVRLKLTCAAVAAVICSLIAQGTVVGAGRLGHPTGNTAAGAVAVSRHLAARDLAPGEGSGTNWCAQHGSYNLGPSLDNVYACGFVGAKPTTFDTDGFQCVELSARFMWAVYGINVGTPHSGGDFVSYVHHEFPKISIGQPDTGQ